MFKFTLALSTAVLLLACNGDSGPATAPTQTSTPSTTATSTPIATATITDSSTASASDTSSKPETNVDAGVPDGDGGVESDAGTRVDGGMDARPDAASSATKTATATKTSTTLSCSLTSCSASGFTYSCGSGSHTSQTHYQYSSSGIRMGWTLDVSYSNGNTVSCSASGTYGNSGSCSGSDGASCRW